MIYLLTKLLHPGVRVLFARPDPCFPLCVVELPGGRRILLAERTYRAPADVNVVVDPTDEDVETARTASRA